MTPPIRMVSVPVEPIVQDIASQLSASIAGLGFPVGLGIAPPEEMCLKAARGIVALYGPDLTAAPVREEGGAVWTGSGGYEPTDAMIDAGEYHNHRHNPLTNMVASFKAMMVQAEIDGLISRTAALATREEAPAECQHEAYEVDSAGQPVRCSDCNATAEAGEVMALVNAYGRWERDEVDSPVEVLEAVGRALPTLRAQPQARSGEGQ